MSFMGFTLNNITMLALILAIGIVIDDAVVVHENIFRHMEEDGMDAMEAASVGTSEIALAVLATSLSLVVIFLPVAFMGGIVGRFFSSFGFVVAFSVVMSLFVSFTLTPMLCSRFLKLEPAEEGHARSKDGFIWRMIDGSYGWVLKFSLRFKWLIVLLTIGVIVSTVPIGKMLQMGFVPRDDQSEFEVVVTAPEGYTLERTDQTLKELEARLWKLRGTQHLFTSTGEVAGGRAVKGEGNVTKGTIYVRLEDLEDRKTKYTQFDIQNDARKLLEEYPDLRCSVNDVSQFQGGSRSQTFQVNLSGPDLAKLSGYADRLVAGAEAAGGGIADLDTTLSLRKPEVQVAIDRERASDFGIPIGTIADSLRILVGGRPVSRFKEGDEQYDVWLRARPADRDSARNVAGLRLPSTKAGLVELGNMATLFESRGPTEIERYGRQRIVTVLGNPESIQLGDAVDRATKIIAGHEPAARVRLRPQRPGQGDGRDGQVLPDRLRPVVPLHVPDPRRAVRELDAAGGDHDGPAGDDPVRPALARPVRLADGHLCDVRPVHAGGDRQEERDLAGRLDQPAPGPRACPGHEAILEANHTRLRPILMTTAMLVAAMVPIALGQGPRRRRPGEHGQGHHRRPGALAGPGPDRHAGLLRPARPVGQLHCGGSASASPTSSRAPARSRPTASRRRPSSRPSRSASGRRGTTVDSRARTTHASTLRHGASVCIRGPPCSRDARRSGGWPPDGEDRDDADA